MEATTAAPSPIAPPTRLPGRVAAADQRQLGAAAHPCIERGCPVPDPAALEALDTRDRRAVVARAASDDDGARGHRVAAFVV